MKQRKRSTIPAKTARTELRMEQRREPAHPVTGRQPMSLARALTEPPSIDDEYVEDSGREIIRWRRAA